jgi:ABC-type multidrug transport system fused ATPase/permease subunit
MKFGERFGADVIISALKLLPKGDRKKIAVVVAIQIFMSGIDLVAVALIGVLGSLTVSGVSSRAPGNRVTQVISFFQLEDFSFQVQAALIGLIAVGLLVTRTALSIFFSRKTLLFLARRNAHITSGLIKKLLSQPLRFIQERTPQETLYALTTGVASITIGIIGTLISVVSDFALILVMAIGLFIIDPIISVSTLLCFILIGFALHRILHKRAFDLGNTQADLEIKSSEEVIEVLSTYRESVVRNRRHHYADRVTLYRNQLAEVQAELAFMPNISKYVVETTIIVGSLAISAVQFVVNDAAQAAASLAIFMAAGTRIAPAVMRLQQGALQVKITIGLSAPTFVLVGSLNSMPPYDYVESKIDFEHKGFLPQVNLKSVSLTYPGRESKAVSDVSISIKPGEFVAIVGGSGAGKTTLVDLLLGILEPDEGDVNISGAKPQLAIRKWPGSIAYVPQDVMIVNGTISENVQLGFPSDPDFEPYINEALSLAQLEDFVRSLPQGPDTYIGDRGSRLSGGQRQRLGIARALFTQPKLVVLDEATSALDGQTELDVSEAIASLRGQVTIITIAHRLSTVRNADRVIYMADGKIVAVGTFDEIRTCVPDFDKQAKLMGL